MPGSRTRPTEALRRFVDASFGRFCLVGAVGFGVDTAILLSLVRLAGLPAVPAKVLSFGVALVVTFQLNRTWAFTAVRHRSVARAFAAYLWVQGTGAACNIAIFALSIAALPNGLPWLGLSAVIASVGGLLVNYIGASRFVFLVQRRNGSVIKP